jgi:hypothetical protein
MIGNVPIVGEVDGAPIHGAVDDTYGWVDCFEGRICAENGKTIGIVRGGDNFG